MSASGTGSLGSQWTLASMHDDDDATGAQIIGAEFEINTPGQTWTITFSDDGVPYFPTTAVSAVTGIRENSATPNEPGTQHMTATAVNPGTGETINAAVDLPPLK